MSTKFKVIFRGEVKQGQDVEQVKQKIAALYKLPVKRMESLFSGKSITIKGNVEHSIASKYQKAFDAVGAVCFIEPEKKAAQVDPLMISKSLSNPSSLSPLKMICPKCKYEQPKSDICKRCGIVIEKYLEIQRKKSVERHPQEKKKQQNVIQDISLQKEQRPVNDISSKKLGNLASKIKSTENHKFHLVGTPVVLFVLLAFALPFISVSCNEQKMLKFSGYELLSLSKDDCPESRYGFSEEEKNHEFTLIILLVISCALGVSIASTAAALKFHKSIFRTGVILCFLGLILTLGTGYYYGINKEAEIKTSQNQAMSNQQEGWEAVGVAMAASLNISIGMDTGYYFILVSFFIGTGGLLVPFVFRQSHPSASVLGAIVSLFIGLLIILSIFMCLKTWIAPAKYNRYEDMGKILEDTTAETGQFPEKLVSSKPIGKLNNSVFNCYLGETLSDMKERGISVVTSAYVFTDQDHPGEIWNISKWSIENDTVEEIRLSTFNDRVYDIQVFFKDNTKANFTSLEYQLDLKYGGKKDTVSFMDEKTLFNTVIDGAPVTITLFFEDDFDDEKDKLSISYTYIQLQNLVYEEIRKRKASKVSTDL